jgi:hypothetical protein
LGLLARVGRIMVQLGKERRAPQGVKSLLRWFSFFLRPVILSIE